MRRVRAIARSVETPEGAADGPEVWMEFKDDPEPERTAAARGLYEGGMVRVNADSTGRSRARSVRWRDSPPPPGQSHLDKYKTISSKMWSFFSEGVT